MSRRAFLIPAACAFFLFLAVTRVEWPVASVNGELIPLATFFALRRIVEGTQMEGASSEILWKLVEAEAMEQLAGDMGVAPTAEQRRLVREDVLRSQDLEPVLRGFLEQYFALQLAMEEAVLRDVTLQRSSRDRAQEAWEGLAEGGVFAGKDLGYQPFGNLLPHWLTAVEGLEKDSFTPVLEDRQFFTILQLVDRVGKGEAEMVRLLEMSFPKKTLGEALDERMKASRVRVFLPGVDVPEDF